MAYHVSFKSSADKALDKLPKSIRNRIIEKASALSTEPRPQGAVKLAGASGMLRIRVGDYRMVYLIDDDLRIVDIRIVAHRREVYRDL
jgi:mRNA interferase RelE/StbE